MGIVNQEAFVASYLERPTTREQATYALSRPVPPYHFDHESALGVYSALREYVVRNGRLDSKTLRPWDITDLYSGLDRSEPWWGWEFETGYRSHPARAEVIAHVWDTWDNVVFDGEGEGSYPSEITFAPQEVSKYDDGTANAYQFMEYLGTHGELIERGTEEAVGTHLNISHPALTKENLIRVTKGLNYTLQVLPREIDGKDVRLKMFGRQRLYSGFHQNSTNTAVWVEGKLFRTAYTMREFRGYMRVGKGLTRALAALCEAEEIKIAVPYVSNLWDVVYADAAPTIAYAAWPSEYPEVNSASPAPPVMDFPEGYTPLLDYAGNLRSEYLDVFVSINHSRRPRWVYWPAMHEYRRKNSFYRHMLSSAEVRNYARALGNVVNLEALIPEEG